MGGWRGTADEEHPDVIAHGAGFIPIPPPQVVQGGFDGLTQSAVQSVGHEGIQSGAFVDFVEVGQRFAGEENASAVARFYRGPVSIVEHALDEVTGRHEILESLLVLNPDAIATEVIGDPNGGDVHPALIQDLAFGQIRRLASTGVEPHPTPDHPIAGGAGFGIGNACGFEVEGGLAEAFLEDAGGMQQFIGNDGVEHAHATLVKHAHDRLVRFELSCEGFAQAPGLAVGSGIDEGHDMVGLVAAPAGLEPMAQAQGKITVGEILAPQGGIGDSGLGERSIEVQHSDEAGPCA
jgi:hypothetical protein